ncbi:hypothetical protein [Photobacterium phosphoreum]|uniref:hypothetical protein n=1 Tax=Photobacterium phosphoreum TaxID=659 RepID=UPI0015E6AE88|nr:hypothetical protein [Photobacterium phosphoreum]
MARTLNDLLALRTKGSRLKIKNMAGDMLRKQYDFTESKVNPYIQRQTKKILP